MIGVDVGTGSARAGVFDATGRMLGTGKADIAVHQEAGSVFEQSSAGIWAAICDAVKGAITQANIARDSVAGIGFDATCSLVVVGDGGRPLPVGASDDPERDIIVWMDHRATEQAARITEMGHDVLKYVGGVISPEMQTPKLLWLRENRPEVFDAAWQFFDLVDFLTWRATGSLSRSLCTVTCKWTYLGHEGRWEDSYFRAIGLGVLADEGFRRIGADVVAPGTALGQGLSDAAARDLGLSPGTPVGAGLIDAHAGGIGTVGAVSDPTTCLAYVFGTSSCTMTTTRDPVFVPGIWGPYFGAMLPDAWLLEGGQSATGAAIDQLVQMHPATVTAQEAATAAKKPLVAWLADAACERVVSLSDAVDLARGIHVVPEFLGNRAPVADPEARAVIAGLDLDRDIDSLVALYVAGLCGIGYGLRQIIEAQEQNDVSVETIVISGGAGQHDLVRQLLADATGKPVVVTATDEPVLLGSAMLGGKAGCLFHGIPSAMSKMSSVRRTFTSATDTTAQAHARRFKAFETLQSAARETR